MAFVETAPGVRIHYETFGEGKPVVFLHGWAMSGDVFNFHHGDTGRYRFIIPDLRGHGLSSASEDSAFSLQDLADDLAALFAALRLDNVILAGWSLGAQVVLQAFPLLREHLAALVLVSGTPRFVQAPGYPHGLPSGEPRGLGLLLKRDFESAINGFFNRMFEGEKVTPASFSLKLPQREAARKALCSLIESDLRQRLPSVDLPVLLIHGRRDAICPCSAARYMAEQLPQGRLEIMETGHAPFLSDPSRFATVLTRFMDEIHAHD